MPRLIIQPDCSPTPKASASAICSLWVSEVSLLESAAKQLEAEARSWAECVGVPDGEGNFVIGKEYPDFQARHFLLVRTAQRIRAMVERRSKANDKALARPAKEESNDE